MSSSTDGQSSSLPKYFYGSYAAQTGSLRVELSLMIVDTIVTGYFRESDSARSAHVGWQSRVVMPDSLYIYDDYSMFGENDTAAPIFAGRFASTNEISGVWRGRNATFQENKNKSAGIKLVHERKAFPNDNDTAPRVDAAIIYPKFSLGNGNAENRMNATVLGKLLEKVDENGTVSQFRSVQSIFETFIQEYNNSIAEYNEYKIEKNADTSDFPEFLPPWYLYMNFTIPLNERGILSYLQIVDVYTGGAHGMTFVDPMVFDCSAGTMLKLEDIFSDEGKTNLTRIADSTFRKNYSIPPDSAINSNGNWFAGDTFYLPKKFYVDQTGMIFFYDLYEVTSYADGMPEIFIPWARIEKLIRKESAVRSLIK